MNLSSIITPFRIYSEYHDQDRFKKDCNNFCEYELITDKQSLLPFQFRRDASVFPFTKIWLRPDCKEFYTQLKTDNQANFITSTGWYPLDCTITSHLAKFTQSGGGYLESGNILTTGNKYILKITISERKQTGTNVLNITVQNGGTPLLAIISPGVYEIPFTCGASLYVTINSLIDGVNDYFTVSQFQIYEIQDFNEGIGDYLLPSTFPTITNLGTKDLITYCGDDMDNTLPCGKYYMIFQSKDNSGNDEYFFSEVIVIKNFIRPESPYVLMEWYNDCDLQDVKYTGLSCDYKNRLYIDGPITKPEYPFTEDGQQDGENNFTPTFQKWEKKSIVIIPKAPEFIVDSITCVRLHDTIKFYPQLRENQNTIDLNDPKVVESMSYEIQYVFQDCAANIELKCLMEGNIVDTTCCTEIAITEPSCCNISVRSVGYYDIDMDPPAYALDMDGVGNLTLYQLNFETDLWEVVDPINITSGTIVCCYESEEYYYWNGSEWKKFPVLSLISGGGTSFTITGTIHPNTVCSLIVVYQGITYALPGVYSSSELASGITVDYADIPITPLSGQTLYVSVSCYNAYCDYGTSNTMNLVFGE